MKNKLELAILPAHEARMVWNKVPSELRESDNGTPLAVGHPLKIEASLINELTDGAKASHHILLNKIAAAGGITAWMKDSPVTFGSAVLNKPSINEQLERRLDQGYGLPLAYDALLAAEKGTRTIKVLEVQTAISYDASLIERFRAAGYDPTDKRTYHGEKSPTQHYTEFSALFAGGEPIVVIDTDLFDGTRFEKRGMQRALGNTTDFPISPLDIVGKDTNGYYYHPYMADENNPSEIKRDHYGNPVKDTAKIAYAKHVLSRMTQFDLDKLAQQADYSQGERIKEFLLDDTINWLWHPTWQHIADKGMLPLLRQELLEQNNSLAEHFVPIYGKDQKIADPGEYIKKPTGEQQGANQSRVTVTKERSIIVEDGYIYQRLIEPYPVRTFMPGTLAAALRTDSQQLMKEADLAAGEELRPVSTNQLELRCLVPPYWEKDIISRYMGRLAPRREDPNGLTRAKTNLYSIGEAVANHLPQNADRQIYPYGISPIIIFDATEGEHS